MFLNESPSVWLYKRAFVVKQNIGSVLDGKTHAFVCRMIHIPNGVDIDWNKKVSMNIQCLAEMFFCMIMFLMYLRESFGVLLWLFSGFRLVRFEFSNGCVEFADSLPFVLDTSCSFWWFLLSLYMTFNEKPMFPQYFLLQLFLKQGVSVSSSKMFLKPHCIYGDKCLASTDLFFHYYYPLPAYPFSIKCFFFCYLFPCSYKHPLKNTFIFSNLILATVVNAYLIPQILTGNSRDWYLLAKDIQENSG